MGIDFIPVQVYRIYNGIYKEYIRTLYQIFNKRTEKQNHRSIIILEMLGFKITPPVQNSIRPTLTEMIGRITLIFLFNVIVTRKIDSVSVFIINILILCSFTLTE